MLNENISFAESIDRLKESFLWAAAQGGNTQDCASLLEIGADINWKNQDGETALIAACRRGHTETIAYLLAHGADANIAGNDSYAPIHICARRGDTNSLDLLLDANTNTLLKTKNGQTALDIAKEKGHEGIYSRIMRQRSTLNRTRDIPSSSGLTQNRAQESNQIVRPELPAVINPAPRAGSSTSSRRQSQQSEQRDAADSEKINPPMSNPAGRSEKRDAKAIKDEATPSASTKNYTIIGQSQNYGEDQSIALKKLLDAEKVAKNILEAKLEVFATQNKQLIEEYHTMSDELAAMQANFTKSKRETAVFQGQKEAINSLSVEECEDYEKVLKATLLKVEERKAFLVKNMIESQKEQRLCVICQEKEKTVVLLPCRHMCLCDACSNHDQLDLCPLCRKPVAHKISVFS